MCIIIYKPADRDFGEDLIRRAYRANRDGFGLMYKEDNSVQVWKTTGGEDEIIQLYNEHKHRELAMHFRLATHGAKDIINCHPYRVLNKAEHGRDLWMMHNGVVTNVPVSQDPSLSDSGHLAVDYLRPLLAKKSSWLNTVAFQNFLGMTIGHSSNKLLFLDDTGRFTFINKHLFTKEKQSGCIVSSFTFGNTTYNGTTTSSYGPRGAMSHAAGMGNTMQAPLDFWDGGVEVDYPQGNATSGVASERSSDESNGSAAVRSDENDTAKTEQLDTFEELTDEDLEHLSHSDMFDVVVAMPMEITEWIYTTLHGQSSDMDFKEDEEENDAEETALAALAPGAPEVAAEAV